MKRYILVINPGSTSTKVAIFDKEEMIIEDLIYHNEDEIKKFNSIYEQKNYRLELIKKWLNGLKIRKEEIIAIAGRGGLLRPIPSGTYEVTELMKDDLINVVVGEHASNLGAILSDELAKELNIKAFVVDSVSTDELMPIARVSGLKDVPRASKVHALNIKAVHKKIIKKMKLNTSDSDMIIAHLGGGISIVPIKNCRLVDVNDANEMGPFSPQRSGGLPSISVVETCYSNKYKSFNDFRKLIRVNGGVSSYLNTTDMKRVISTIEDNEYNKLIVDAMCYQISKEIGRMATVLKGNVKYIVLTGGLAYSEYIVEEIKKRVSFITEVLVEPGQEEMSALNLGVLRVIKKEEEVKIYEKEIGGKYD